MPNEWEYQKIFESPDQIDYHQKLIYMKKVMRGEWEELLKEENGVKLFGRNWLKKITKKKVDLIYSTEPERIITAAAAGSHTIRNTILPQFNELMKKIAWCVESYGSAYLTGEFGVVEPWMVWEGDGETVIRKEAKKPKGRAYNIFDWVYRSDMVMEYQNGKHEATRPDRILKIYKRTEGDLAEIENYDLGKMQVEAARLYSLLKHGHSLQCLSVPWTDDPELDSLDFGYGVVNQVRDGKKIGLLKFQAGLAETLNFLNEIRDGIFEDSGIPRVSIAGDVKANSARELIVKWAPLVETRTELVGFYAKAEKDVLNFEAQIFGIHGVSLETFFDRDYMPTETREISEIEWRIENNLMSLRDVLKTENPGISGRGLDRTYEENKRENAAWKMKKTENEGQGADAAIREEPPQPKKGKK